MKKLKYLIALFFITSIVSAQPTSLSGEYFSKPLWMRSSIYRIGLLNSADTLQILNPFILGMTKVTATGIQLNYLSGAIGTTGTSNLVFSASPTLTGKTTVDSLLVNDLTSGYLPYYGGTRLKNSGIYYDPINGFTGIGVLMPTAFLHLKAGTATAGTAPLKFSLIGSVLNTTPERGAIEADIIGNLYRTDSSAVRSRITTVADNLSAFASTTSAQLAGVISDETGSGALVLGTAPTFDSGITVSGGAITGNTLTRGTDSFTTTATADTVAITGAGIGDIYILTYVTAVTAAEAPLSVVSTATGFIATRPAGTTSGATYAYIRQK